MLRHRSRVLELVAADGIVFALSQAGVCVAYDSSKEIFHSPFSSSFLLPECGPDVTSHSPQIDWFSRRNGHFDDYVVYFS